MRRFYDAGNDELAKWEATPFWIAAPKLAAIRDKIEADAKRIGQSAWPAAAWAPSLVSVRYASAGADQQFATLETVEALRLHAAIHGGLPETGTIYTVRHRVIVHLAPSKPAPFP